MGSKTVTLDQMRARRPANRKRVDALRESMLLESRAYRLAELRKSADLTQAELAKVLGIDQSGVSRIERGRFETTEIGTLAAFVEALGGSLEIRVRVGKSTHRLVDATPAKPTKSRKSVVRESTTA